MPDQEEGSQPNPTTSSQPVIWGAGSASQPKKQPIPNWLWALIALTIMAVGGIVSYADQQGFTRTNTPPPQTFSSPPATTKQQYLTSAAAIDYRMLSKNPDSYAGMTLQVTGEIVQIMEDASGTNIRLAVTRTEYGYDYTDIVWAYYPGRLPVFEGNIVRLWGDCNGAYSYESQAGWQITVPSIFARYWAKVQ